MSKFAKGNYSKNAKSKKAKSILFGKNNHDHRYQQRKIPNALYQIRKWFVTTSPPHDVGSLLHFDPPHDVGGFYNLPLPEMLVVCYN